MFNGMATGADWMSAASFIGLAGGLYFDGFSVLAFVMGGAGGGGAGGVEAWRAGAVVVG